MTASLIVVFVILAVLLVAGIVVARKFVISPDDSDGPVGSLIAPCVLSIYLIALAMGLVIGWENNRGAADSAVEEAGYATALYWGTAAFPDKEGDAVRADLRDYVDTVIEEDWPAMREQRELDPSGAAALDRLRVSVNEVPAEGSAAALERMEARQNVTDLVQSRVERADSAQATVPGVILLATAVSGLAVVVLPFAMRVGQARTRIFWSVVNLVFIVSSLLILLALDHPYTGLLATDSGAFEDARAGFDRIDAALAGP
ncbi:DUF4239 domain-containing protein [Streptomonospora nanhaiensis]|uniref:Outer membrane murein-binding lipoprotein Lpp n=1 Tax=Streptomonospora nanhaiensis TaxID=1323731 RepID=A0A853BNM7_9ACTN|nr:DUF4239 domain-containing protein [Streptomonospora nanhaiensis]MBV2361932.1 DUF4239 domain-containing protein [Streptomonospora nanhaiensis]MBX9388642.1 DUF4239 domain-containing protein [Streptomonospora nanhaiensis]NYI96247.1 outer membrane murein-binding lipoprotein Lpp [Streptomonospora nanhaiensis]